MILDFCHFYNGIKHYSQQNINVGRLSCLHQTVGPNCRLTDYKRSERPFYNLLSFMELSKKPKCP